MSESIRHSHTGGDAVVDVLEAIGASVVFGIPSVHNLPVYDALYRRGSIRVVTVRHEQAAAGAADGYARVSGRLGVFLTSTGPGAANAMGGLLEASVSGSPVLHLTGQIETAHLDKGRGFIHEVPDQPGMLGALSKAVLRASSADAIAATVAEGASAAVSPPAGPVSVELPIDLQYAGADPRALDQAGSPLTAPDGRTALEVPLSWEDAADRIRRARRPVVWAGGGVVGDQAEDRVANLVRALGAALLTSPNARGVLPESDPLCIGNLSWDPDVRQLVADADLLVGIGTRYQGPNTENWKMRLPTTIVQIDVDPSVPARNYAATVAAQGRAGDVVEHVLRRLGQEPPLGPERGWTERVAAAAANARRRLRRTLGAQEGLLDELSAAIGPDTVVVKDSTIPAYTWGNRLLPVWRTRRAIMPNGFAIGLGLPHALGAAVASGQPVVLMVGDGGVMLAISELATLAAEGLPVVVLVFADGGYGILRNIQERQYARCIGVELGSPDFVALAASLGVAGERVASSAAFGKAVQRGLGGAAPYLVQVDLAAIGPMARPYTGTSRPPSGGDQA